MADGPNPAKLETISDVWPSEIYVELQDWPAKNGVRRLTLVVTFDALLDIFTRETGVIDPQDAWSLMEALGRYAESAEKSDDRALDMWLDASASEEDEDD